MLRHLGAVASALLCISTAVAVLIEPQLPSASAYGFFNANQEVLADPSRAMIYFSETDQFRLTFIDSDTGDVISTIPDIGSIQSMDVSPDGSSLYLSDMGTSTIKIVDPNTRSVTKEMSLGFVPFSLKVGRPTRLYVSSNNDAYVHILDEKNGHDITSFAVGTGALKILDVSPDGNTLLVGGGGYDPSNLYKYSIATDTPQLLGSNTSATAMLRQFVVDWTNGTIFMATSSQDYIEILSLTTLQNIGNLQVAGRPKSVEISRDGSTLFVVANTDFDNSMLYAFSVADHSLIGTTKLSKVVDWIVTPLDQRYVFVGPLPERIPLHPTGFGAYPAPGAVFAYTPSHVAANLTLGVPPITAGASSIWVDDVLSLPRYFENENILRGNFSSNLADGSHSVSVNMSWKGESYWVNWTFTIDRGSTGSLRPSVYAGFPEPDAVFDFYPTFVAAQVFFGEPAIEPSGWSMSVDGNTVPSYISAEGYLRSDNGTSWTLGSHEIAAEILWAGERSNTTWSFTIVSRICEFMNCTPYPDQILASHDVFIWVGIDRGFPEVTITSYELKVNGNVTGSRLSEALYDYTENRTFYILESSSVLWLENGRTWVTTQVWWAGGTIRQDWNFTVQASENEEPQPFDFALVMYEHPGSFDLPVPRNWTRQEDQTLEGEYFDLVVYGPVFDSLRTNILVTSIPDLFVEETHSYLQEQMTDTIEDLESSGTIVDLQSSRFLEVSGHGAIAFTIEWVGEDITQMIVIVASEDHGRLWLIVFTISSTMYLEYRTFFNDIVTGFEITMNVPVTEEEKEDVLYQEVVGISIAAIAGALAGLVVWSSRKRKAAQAAFAPAITSPVPQLLVRPVRVAPAIVPSGCPFCMHHNRPGATYCGFCGRDLPPGTGG